MLIDNPSQSLSASQQLSNLAHNQTPADLFPWKAELCFHLSKIHLPFIHLGKTLACHPLPHEIWYRKKLNQS